MEQKIARCENGFRRNSKTKACERKEVIVIDLVSPAKSKKKRNVEVIDLVSPEKQILETGKNLKKRPKNNTKKKRSISSSSSSSSSSRSSIKSSIKSSSTRKREREIESANRKTKKLQKSKKQAETNLRRFFRKNAPAIKHKIRTQFLKSICSDSGVCIAFGKEENKIKQFFDNFVDFNWAISRRRIGAPSVNGFVYEITYERDNYLAHAVLKSSTKASADNLSYEYFVGKIINKHFIKRFPCFVETYGMYQYKFEPSYETMKNNTNAESLQYILKLYPDNVRTKRACEFSKYLSLLTQNISNASTLKSMLTVEAGKRTNAECKMFAQNDLAGCLYQLYFALNVVRDFFTHYDLHYQNVLIFEPVVNKYIHYNYVGRNGSVCSFKSKYIVKMIDYGRSFILDHSNLNGSMTEYTKVCAEPKCITTCGDRVGYAWLDPDPNDVHINSTKKNNTKDLWLLAIMGRPEMIKHFLPELHMLLKKVAYNDGAENLTVGYPHAINNVSDAERCLRDLINAPAQVQRNNALYDAVPYTKLGDLNIRSGHEMTYVPTPP
jgi:hypothetical protein